MKYGLAIDIGTTNIKMAKVNLEDGSILAEYQQKNSQKKYGADVMSRIQHACAGDAGALTALVRQDILSGMCALQAEEAACTAIACNTTMMALLCGDDLSGMQEYPFCPARLAVPETENVRIAPAAGAFLGGDIVAGLSVLPENSTDFLFIDLGTNGELVLDVGGRRLAASAAAGPAFEYMADASGSMLLEVVKEALENGMADETGLLAEEWFDSGYHWKSADGTGEFVLTQKKIRDVQLAKAAIRTGVDYLLEQYEVLTGTKAQVKRVYLAGGMGVLSEQAGLRVGLLPKSMQGKCKFLGNTALQGAVQLLLERDSFDKMQTMAKQIDVYNLAAWEKFNEKFVENINFPVK